MESKDLLDLCRQHGIDVKSQLSSLTDEQRDEVVKLTSRGPAVATAAPPSAIPATPGPIRHLPPSKPPVLPRGTAAPKPPATPRPAAPTPAPTPPPTPDATEVAPTA